MKALIDPRFSVQYISSWEETPPKPVYSTYPDSARVCEVSDNDFFVAEPLFWIDCESFVVADQYWFNTTTNVISEIQNAPNPT